MRMEQRIERVLDQHCGRLLVARRLTDSLIDKYYDLDSERLDSRAQEALQSKLLEGYDTVQATLEAVSEILYTLDVDLAAAQGCQSDAVIARRGFFKEVYGLAEASTTE